MITRRRALWIGLGLPAGIAAAASPGEFWNEKNSSDWTAEEVQQLLTRSPWAKDAGVTYNSGPGGAGRIGNYGGAPSTGRRSRGGTSPTGGASLGQQQYKAVVRWESALPIREATHSRSSDDPLASYALNVIGDLPMLGSHRDEDQTQQEQRMEMLREYTKLERRNDPIYLARVNFQSASGTLFYFSRLEPIDAGDKQITFTTKLGPIEVKAKFVLKDMLYRGKLAL